MHTLQRGGDYEDDDRGQMYEHTNAESHFEEGKEYGSKRM
jgi:hypothetical protein